MEGGGKGWYWWWYCVWWGEGRGVITHYSCLQVMVQCYKQTNQGHINWGSHVPHVSLQSFDKTTDFSEWILIDTCVTYYSDPASNLTVQIKTITNTSALNLHDAMCRLSANVSILSFAAALVGIWSILWSPPIKWSLHLNATTSYLNETSK